MHLAAESESVSADKLVQLLVRKSKAMLEEQDNYGRTPLHIAAAAGNIEVMRMLLASGCNRKALDNEKYTALHWAASELSYIIHMLLNECCELKMPHAKDAVLF